MQGSKRGVVGSVCVFGRVCVCVCRGAGKESVVGSGSVCVCVYYGDTW